MSVMVNTNGDLCSNGGTNKQLSNSCGQPSDQPKRRSIYVKDLNEQISCFICKGYLIDATTLVECNHSFCKTCIITHLESNTPKSRYCPQNGCDIQIHKTKPKLNIRSDPTLQDIVYKLIPGLYKNEMNKRKEFYSKHPESAVGLSNEERGEMSGERLIFTPEDSIYLAIEYFPQVISYSLLPFSKNLNNGRLNVEPITAANGQVKDKNDSHHRYLKCEGGMRVLHLKKWLKLKYDVRDYNDIEIFYKHDPLLDEYTMIDLAYIYSWRRNGPLCLYYKIIEPQKTSWEEYRPFKAPSEVANRRTPKHRHKQQNNKKRKLMIDESNLITTNPVNEPLPPVDTQLINKVMATNSIGTNLDIMTTVVNSALNMNNNHKKPKKCPKNGLKANDCIKQMKKKLDKSLKMNNKSVVPSEQSVQMVTQKSTVPPPVPAINSKPESNKKLNKTPKISKKSVPLPAQPILQSQCSPLPPMASKKSSVRPLTPDIYQFMPFSQNSSQCLPNMSKTDLNKKIDKSLSNNNTVPLPPLPLGSPKTSVPLPVQALNPKTNSTKKLDKSITNKTVGPPLPLPSTLLPKSPVPLPVTGLMSKTDTTKKLDKSLKANNKSVPLSPSLPITSLKSTVPMIGPVPTFLSKGNLNKKLCKSLKNNNNSNNNNKTVPQPSLSMAPSKSPVALPVGQFMSPLMSPLSAPDIFQFMPSFAQNSSKCLPNMSKTESNSDNKDNDIEVALNLSTSKDKTT